MEENYSAADEYDNLEDIFEDIPEDQVEETEREIRNLRKWFDIFEEEYCDDEGLPDDDEEEYWDEEGFPDDDEEGSWDEESLPDDDKEDAWEEESLQDDDMELYAVPEKTCESGELRGEKPESDWNEIEMDIQKESPGEEEEPLHEEEVDLDDPELFAFLYNYYMEHERSKTLSKADW